MELSNTYDGASAGTLSALLGWAQADRTHLKLCTTAAARL